jgi:hypothetical protein
MPLRLIIASDLFTDNNRQEVIIREQLPVDSLLAEICREYELPSGNYVLHLEGGQPLKTNQTLEQAGIRMGDVLFFGIGGGANRATLTAENGQVFDLFKQSALIGRPNPQKQLLPEMVDVDLTPLDPEHTTSRPHAKITRNQGTYYIESLNENNLVYVNNIAVPIGILQPLKPKDWLRFGKVKLQFNLSGS